MPVQYRHPDKIKWEPYKVSEWVYDGALVHRYYIDPRYPIVKTITSHRSQKTGRYYGTSTRRKHLVRFHVDHCPEICGNTYQKVYLRYSKVAKRI